MRASRKHRARAEPATEPGSIPGSAPATEFMVGRSADEVLGRAQLYFARRWPHTGEVNRLRASVEFSANTRTRYGQLFLELSKVAILSLLTVGVYLLYWLVFRRSQLINRYRAEVFAREQEDGTLIRISAGTAEYRQRLQDWAVRELGGQPLSR